MLQNWEHILNTFHHKLFLNGTKLTCWDLGGPNALDNELPLELARPLWPELNKNKSRGK